MHLITCTQLRHVNVFESKLNAKRGKSRKRVNNSANVALFIIEKMFADSAWREEVQRGLLHGYCVGTKRGKGRGELCKIDAARAAGGMKLKRINC